jgi:DNA-binding NarL/FixJ family response regulator
MEQSEAITLAIVEDDPRIRETLSSLITLDEGLSLLCQCPSAEVALEELPVLKPQVAIVDIGLPGMNGIELVRQLAPGMPGTQFLMYTVHDSDQRVFEALKAGANGYLLKNTSTERIRKAVRELLQGGAPMSTAVARRVIDHFRPIQEHNEQHLEPLTEREYEVLSLLAEGLIYKEIAERMGIATSTIGQHVHAIYRKLHVQTRTEAVNRYFGR